MLHLATLCIDRGRLPCTEYSIARFLDAKNLITVFCFNMFEFQYNILLLLIERYTGITSTYM
jgi:hypothetical protein